MSKDIHIRKVLYYLSCILLVCWIIFCIVSHYDNVHIFELALLLSIIIFSREKYKKTNKKEKKYSFIPSPLEEILSNSPAGLTALLDSMSCITYIKDFEHDKVYGNKRFEEIKQPGKKVSDIFFEDLYRLDNPYELTEDDIEALQHSGVTKFVREIKTDIGEMWFEISKAPIFDSCGKIKGVIAIMNNITVQTEVELQKESFIALLKHDLRTPVIAQMQAIKILQSGLSNEESSFRDEILTDLYNSCRYMFNMISTVIKTYKIEKGEIELSPAYFNIIEAVKEVSNSIEYFAHDRGQNIIIESKLNNETVKADISEIKQAVSNLLYNAINNSNPKTDIKIRLSEEFESVVLEIHSVGHTLSKEKLDDVFNKYFMFKNKFRLVGNGLGLYVSKEIINRHKGEMIAYNDKDGTTFGFVIPRKYAENRCKILNLPLNIRSDAVEAYAEQ